VAPPLKISLLGGLQVCLGDQPITTFESNKVRALLAYLVVEAERPQSREALAALLWPDYPQGSALTNLRYALSNLRQSIGDREAQPPFLLITRESIQFNAASNHWLDVAIFVSLAAKSQIESLEQATALYRGDFLSGFFVSESAPFEEWVARRREGFHRQAMRVLSCLANSAKQRGEYEQAQNYAHKQLELEPWSEEAHQQVMHALALAGQRSAALAQYEICRRSLAKELGV